MGIAILGLAVIGAVLFAASSISNWRSSRDVNKARANVNAALANVNAAKGVVANDRAGEAVAIEQVKQAANDVITASTATDEAKAEANAAVANYEAAKKAGVPTGTTEEDLRRKLEALGQ